MRKATDMTGQRYGQLTVIEKAYLKNGHMFWKCKCDCGNEKIIDGSKLRDGTTKACGCLRGKGYKDLVGKRFGMLEVMEKVGTDNNSHVMYLCKCDCGNIKTMLSNHIQISKSCGCMHGANFKTHGMGKTRLFYIWSNMKQRCQNPNIKNYERYGARGIKVCDEWQEFVPFMEWALANGYSEDLSIDRIDSNGNYKPSNCRWATIEVQANNKRSNSFIEYNGEKRTIAEWSKITGISSSTILMRQRRGWGVDKIFQEVRK